MTPEEVEAVAKARDTLAQLTAYLARYSEGLAILHQAPDVIYSPLHDEAKASRDRLDEVLRADARAAHPGRPTLSLVQNHTKEP